MSPQDDKREEGWGVIKGGVLSVTGRWARAGKRKPGVGVHNLSQHSGGRGRQISEF